ARLGSDWLVSDCTAQGNATAGFAGKYGNVFTRCNAADNRSAGFALSNAAGLISQCCARNNDGPGISLGDTAVITECTIHGNGEEGIVSLNGQINVRGCHISANDGVGIDTSTSSSIEGCTVRENLGGGILVHSRCRVVGNTVTHNALVLDSEDAGIEVMGGNNRIDSNQLASNNIGIRCDAIPANDNIIIRNTVSGSTGDDFLVDDTDNLLAPVRTSFIGAGPWDNFTP
ncbi:right-handed parallel beta-helix repeat-containing protein, partial [Candidatus Sumerlaeota bacterium]|nr:right-handed parallel beta-helix repeat-containing protein [Candidatus Sumerlaeota bacterium]